MSTSEIAKLESRWRDNPQGLTFAPLAEAYRKQGDPVRALEILLPGLERHPDYIPANIVLGRCHWDLDSLEASEQAFAHVIELDGENVIALKAMADIAERRGRYDEAERWVEKLLAVDRSNDEAREQLARLRAARPEASSGAPAPAPIPDPPHVEPAQVEPAHAEASQVEPAQVELAAKADAGEPMEPAPALDDYDPARIELPDPGPRAAEVKPAAEREPGPEPEFELTEEIELRVSGESEYRRPSAAEELARSAKAGASAAEGPPEDSLPAPAPALASASAGPGPASTMSAAPPPGDQPQAGDEVAIGSEAPALHELAARDEPSAPAEPGLLVTETMADVYLQQGHIGEALAVYRELVRRKPGDAALRARVAELERRRDAAAPGAARPRYSARETGGQSVAEFFQALLEARPAFPPARPAGGRPGGAEPVPAPRTADGPAIRPAADPLSLDSVFGEEPSPVAPAAPGPESPRGSGPPGVSFDDFFGGATPGGGVGPAGGSPRGKRDDDLDQFQSWLQSLKR